jgi:DNA-binding beta-propeller fold protein YncE
VLAAIGLIFVTGNTNPGAVYVIDPIGGSGPVGFQLSPWGANPLAISFDGERIWTANNGSVSILTFDLRIPIFSLNTVTAGFDNTQLNGILYDGSNIWVSGTNHNRGKLFKLDSNGGIIQTVNAGNVLKLPVFDGTNIWVPSQGSDAGSDSVMVVRASTGEILATLTGNGLNGPVTAAFDGERILVTNYAGNSVSLWRATDLSPLGFFPTGAGTVPYGACSDGLNFWITLSNAGELVRF